MADADDFKLIYTTAIPQLSVVRFYTETVDHIVDQHPEFAGELPSVMESIATTVSDPSIIYKSTHPRGESYVFCSYTNTFWDMPMYVPVKVIGDTSSGLLKTAYYSDTGKGEIIWQKS